MRDQPPIVRTGQGSYTRDYPSKPAAPRPLFAPAVKTGAKARVAIYGPAGAGKTYTALRIARGLVGPTGRIALIDTERRTARKYADRFTFDVCELDDRSLDGYAAAIRAAASYDVTIVDSLSHAWHELVAEVERIAKARHRNNTWSAWTEGTPKQRSFIDLLLQHPGHLIATMRSKTEWQTVSDAGKARPVRVGLTPEQGKGIEYEFDLLLEIAPTHAAEITKDRTGRYQDQVIDRPGEEFGAELAAWLADGSRGTLPPDQAPPTSTTPPSTY